MYIKRAKFINEKVEVLDGRLRGQRGLLEYEIFYTP